MTFNFVDLIESLFEQQLLSPIKSRNLINTHREHTFYQLFNSYFNTSQDGGDEDDLLFLVSKLQTLSVKRCTDFPIFDENMNWEETFFLNLFSRLEYRLRVSICVKNLALPAKVLWRSERRVFAEPTLKENKRPKAPIQFTFPLIYFSVHDYDEVFKELLLSPGTILCVELFAILRPESFKVAAIDEPDYVAIKEDSNCLILFQGAVNYGALYKAHEKKIVLNPNTPQRVSMKDSNNNGIAQVEVTDITGIANVANVANVTNVTNASSSSFRKSTIPRFISHVYEGVLRKYSNPSAKIKMFHCAICTIGIHFQNILQNLSRWSTNFIQAI